MDVRGPDHRRLVERRRAATLRSGFLGAGRGGSNRRAGRPRMAQALAQGPVDTGFWGARAAGVAALERELARLRRAQTAHAREQGRTIARASVLNLVVYAEREVHARRAALSISELSLRHPSRAIVLLADRGAREGVEGRIDMHCHLPSADSLQQVCYEQILLRARGDSDERLASAVIPLLVPDLPVFLWWTGNPPFGRRHFEGLTALADRLIFDSADFARPDQVLPAIARVSEQARGRFGITDLNWTRLTPWREIVSTFFDVPAYRPFLDVITGVRVGFAVDMDGRDIHPSQALLFVGWLASRLGWRATQSPAPAEAGGHPLAPAPGGGAPMKGRLRAPLPRRPDEGGASGASPPSGTGGAPTAVRVERPPA